MTYANEIIACAALLLAVTILDWFPPDMRRGLFSVITATGTLAAVAANAPAIASVTSLFG